VNQDEFGRLLQQFAERPVPAMGRLARHVYIWQQTVDSLIRAAPRGFIHVVDLHRLCQELDRTPNTADAARKLLSTAIDRWLSGKFSLGRQQRGLAVTGCDLLARYAIPLSPMAQLASENCLVCFVAPVEDSAFVPAAPLPSMVRLQPDATVSYLKAQLPDEAIVGG
jgi:hypothetical protein